MTPLWWWWLGIAALILLTAGGVLEARHEHRRTERRNAERHDLFDDGDDQ